MKNEPGATIDLGGGHRLLLTRSCVEHLPEGATMQTASGAIHEHPHAKEPGQTCAGYVHFRGRPDLRTGEHPMWDVVSEDPVTLSPSLLCRTCGRHGFVRAGKWEEA